jgi:acyl-CoA-binding protein
MASAHASDSPAFRAAAEYVRQHGDQWDSRTLLQLYALYKQVA